MVSQDEQNSFFETTNEMWERAKKVYELVDNYHDNRHNNNSNTELGLGELQAISQEIKKLKEEKEKLIKVSIGYMYNGVLVSGDISCRRGEIYRFRCQYKLSLQQIKQSLMKGLVEVGEKLTDTNLGILETLLEMIDENEREYSRYNSSKGEKATLEVADLRVAEFSRDYGVEFKIVKKIEVEEDGDMTLRDKDDRSMSLDDYSKFMVKAKLKEELKDLSQNFITKQTERRDNLQTEIATIRSKAQNLLMLREIDRQEDTN